MNEKEIRDRLIELDREKMELLRELAKYQPGLSYIIDNMVDAATGEEYEQIALNVE